MAEFLQTMKDWRRMCNACQPEKDIRGVCGCYPAGNYAPCTMKSMNKEADLARDNRYFERLEKTITEWAAEHPEPVYPSVAEYLERLGITIRRDGTVEADFFKANEPMSADAAKLLGVEAKENV